MNTIALFIASLLVLAGSMVLFFKKYTLYKRRSRYRKMEEAYFKKLIRRC